MIINMYNYYDPYSCPYNPNIISPNNMPNPYHNHICPFCYNPQFCSLDCLERYTNYDYRDNYKARSFNSNMVRSDNLPELKDYGPEPFVINIEKATTANNNFRTVLWTGKHLQVTLMSLKVGEDIGLEIHRDTDQFLRLEEGEGIVRMGDTGDNLNYERRLSDDTAIMVPAGKWHNIINTGRTPLKLYSIYAPPHHPHGAVHQTKAIAEEAERKNK
jgi:mannose-6-phosphate isomerase-like protein (cupin superfamily)